MILDAIIAFVAGLLALVAGAVVVPVVALVNLLAAGLELVIGVFVSGFELGRLSRPGRSGALASGIVLLVVVAVVGVLLYLRGDREVTLVAEDGHSLPLAAVVVETGQGEEHQRSDASGHITVPRFGLRSVTIKDPRYVERTWSRREIGTTLVVERTVLGGALDRAAEFLLKPEKGTRGEAE